MKTFLDSHRNNLSICVCKAFLYWCIFHAWSTVRVFLCYCPTDGIEINIESEKNVPFEILRGGLCCLGWRCSDIVNKKICQFSVYFFLTIPNSFFKKKTFCPSRKSTVIIKIINNKLNDGWIPFNWFSFRVLYCSCCHSVLGRLNRTEPSLVLLVTLK